MKWARINRNSLAQFMKTRLRYVHVSAPLVIVQVPGTAMFRTVPKRPGITYRRSAKVWPTRSPV